MGIELKPVQFAAWAMRGRRVIALSEIVSFDRTIAKDERGCPIYIP